MQFLTDTMHDPDIAEHGGKARFCRNHCKHVLGIVDPLQMLQLLTFCSPTFK